MLKNMLTKARQNSVRDNESNNDGSLHLIQSTGTGLDGKDRVTWTSIWLPELKSRNLMDRHFFVVFALHRGLKSAKHRHHQVTPMF